MAAELLKEAAPMPGGGAGMGEISGTGFQRPA
jgi:hypothetical protein